MEGLPYDVLYDFLVPHLTVRDICRLAQCSHTCKELFYNDGAWRWHEKRLQKGAACLGSVFDSRYPSRIIFATRMLRSFDLVRESAFFGKWWARNLLVGMLAVYFGDKTLAKDWRFSRFPNECKISFQDADVWFETRRVVFNLHITAQRTYQDVGSYDKIEGFWRRFVLRVCE